MLWNSKPIPTSAPRRTAPSLVRHLLRAEDVLPCTQDLSILVVLHPTASNPGLPGLHKQPRAVGEPTTQAAQGRG